MSPNNLITLILSSTVIATLVSSMLVYINNRKTHYLNSIFEERQNWRHEIKKIVAQISECNDYDKLAYQINSLKVMIVPTGFFASSTDEDVKAGILNDSFLWELFEEIESLKETERNDIKVFNHYKKMLIEYLSAIHNNDWEKAKKDVSGTTPYIPFLIAAIMGVLAFTVYYANLGDGSHFNNNVVLIIVVGSILSIVFGYCYQRRLQSRFESYEFKKLLHDDKKNLREWFIMYRLIFLQFLCSLIIYFIISGDYVFKLIGDLSSPEKIHELVNTITCMLLLFSPFIYNFIYTIIFAGEIRDRLVNYRKLIDEIRTQKNQEDN